jgi:tetratricopeptide (TPR) repeat protein
MKRWQEAVEAYERSLKLDPENRYALWGYGRACVELKRFDKALALLADGISRSAAVVEGNSAASRRDFCFLLRGIPKPTDLRPLDEFIARHEKARPEQHPIVLEGLALAYLHAPARRDLQKAEELALRALGASGPRSVDPQVTLASVRFAQGEVASAVRLLEEHLDPAPMGAHQELLQRCREALSPDLASFASVDALVASCSATQENPGPALAAFERLHATPERLAIGAYLRARILEGSGQDEEAAHSFQAALAASAGAWSTAIPLVGACIAGSDALRRTVGEACRAALAAPAPAGVLSRALAALRALAVPGEEIRGMEGVYVGWVLGPFARTALFQGNLPFASFDLHEPVLYQTRTLAWQPQLSSSFEIDFEKVLGSRARSSAFFYLEVEAPVEVDAQVSLTVDDEASFRLNGIELHRLEGAVAPRSAVFPARFLAGLNRMLLEVRNLDGSWGATMRITDGRGSPIPLRQRF